MARVDTLTAYKCKFRYMQRNNPLIEEQREEIKSGNEPTLTFEDFISLYSENSDKILIGKNSDRAIGLSKQRISSRTLNKTKSWYISPIAGKQGQPMTVVKRSTGKRYDFGSDAAALYNYHLFVYENENGIIAIFHRQNGSGCKSVFLETANNILKEKGIKLEMDLIVPLSDTTRDVTPTKITLQYIEENPSSDVADNLRKRKSIIRDVGLNLEVRDNSKVASIMHNMQLGKISKEAAFVQIKEEVKSIGEFNDAEVRFKIGRRTRNVSWNEFENIVGIHDISEELHSAYKRTNNFVEELTKLSDRYYYEIIKSGVVDDE
jgi:hypothetical protein